MYRSMWRLVVYVAPEYLPRYAEIVGAIGEALFQEVGSEDARNEYPKGALSNDPMLDRELKTREREMKRRAAVPGVGTSATPRDVTKSQEPIVDLGMILQEVAVELGVELKRDPVALKEQIQSLMRPAAQGGESAVAGSEPSVELELPSPERFMETLARQLGARRFSGEQREKFEEFYLEFLASKGQNEFDRYLSRLESSLVVTADDRHRPFKIAVVLKRLRELLDENLFSKDSGRLGS